MRQAIFIIVLAAASFLGGAIVNRPSLHWAQIRLLNSLGLTSKDELASVDLKALTTTDGTADRSRSVKPEPDVIPKPFAPMPSLVTDDRASQRSGSERNANTAPKTGSTGKELPGSTHVSSSPSDATTSVPPPIRFPLRGSSSDPNVEPVALRSPPAPPSSPPLSRTESASASSSASVPPPKSGLYGSDDWAVLERRMQSLGVWRFTIDGEPGGRVVFSCLIPVAGRQAVAQRFEADGDDVVQAAQAALRRIVLWQRTHPPSR